MAIPTTGITTERWVVDVPNVGTMQVLPAGADAEVESYITGLFLAEHGLTGAAVVSYSAWRTAHGL